MQKRSLARIGTVGQRLYRSRLFIVSLCAAALLADIGRTWPRWTYPRLFQRDPSLQVLNDPPRLLTLAATFNGHPGSAEADRSQELQREALLALLRLQEERFGVRLPPQPEGTGASSPLVVEHPSKSPQQVRLVAGLHRRTAADGDYWGMELLTFDRSGRLLARAAYDPNQEESEVSEE